jgi:hypothetical protein
LVPATTAEKAELWVPLRKQLIAGWLPEKS